VCHENCRTTYYKHNKRVILPKAVSTDTDFECEKGRRSYINCLNEYTKVKMLSGGAKGIKNKNVEGFNSKMGKQAVKRKRKKGRKFKQDTEKERESTRKREQKRRGLGHFANGFLMVN